MWPTTGPTGELQLIDFDAMFLPAFAGRRSPELGTRAYQHPAREAADFDVSLDDYPAALISTALHALALDPSLARRHASDGVLFTPSRMRDDGVLEEVLTLFEERGMAIAYRIARLLLSPTLKLFGLAGLLARAVEAADAANGPAGEKTPPDGGQTPELFAENGLWGYRCGERVVVAPLYDCGFDFSEGLAAVRLGHTWHYIDPAGVTRLSLPGCEAVKPFRGGRARIFRRDGVHVIDREGHECEA